MQQITLGDEHQPRARSELVERLLDPVEQFDRMREQGLPRRQYLANRGQRQRVAAKLHRRFDHRKGETLRAIAVMRQVAQLGRGHHLTRDAGIGERREHRHQCLLRRGEEAHIVPKRIVGIEADQVDHRRSA